MAIPQDLKLSGKSKHVFVCYSINDSQFVRGQVINPLKNKNFITCDFEQDFIPGLSIFENITTAIRECRKYVMIISNSFKRSSWCGYESQLTLSLSIDMRASNVVIPLLIESVKIPDFLSIFRAIEITDNEWFEKLCSALEMPMQTLTDNPSPPPLRNKIYHFISVAHLNTIDNTGLLSEKMKKLEDIKQRFLNFLDVRIQAKKSDCSLVLHGKKFDFITKEFIEIVVENIKKSSKILLWLSDDFQSDIICQSLRKMVCLMAEDMSRQSSPWIIPVYLGNDFKIPDDLGLTCLFTRNGNWYRLLLDTICRADIFYRCKHQTLKFREGEELFRVAEFDGSMTGDESNPRFLGITFVDDGNIILLDADNKKIKKCTLFGKVLKSKSLEKRPNRISRINDTHVTIIYENDKEIVIVDTNTFETKVIKPILRREELIKGITALSSSVIFVATNGGKDQPRILKIKIERVKTEKTDDLVKDFFEMPRRMTTTPDKSKIIIADENDRRLVLMDRHGKIVNSQNKWNKRLYNVRGLAASNDTIFIAACNGITTADINTLEVAETPLIKFPSDVYHTGAVALDPDGKFLAISQAVENKEIVRIFFMTRLLDMSSVEHDLDSEQQISTNSVIQVLWKIFEYIE